MLDSIDIACRRARLDATPRMRPLIAIDMELVVVAPQLLALPPPILDSSKALARLSSWATRTPLADGRDLATLSSLPVAGTSVAELIARGSIDPAHGTIDTGDGHWLLADPITLVAGRDDVAIAGRVTGLDAPGARDFVARVVDALNTHFAADAMTFIAARAGRWLLRLPDAPRLRLVPTDVAVGGSLYAHRPQGDDARRFERYGNEIQMMLFAAPENDERERAGLAALNGLWLWGNAEAPASSAAPARIDAFAAPGEDGDLARGAALATGGTVQAPDAGFAALASKAVTDPRLRQPGVDARAGDRACVLVALPALQGADDFGRWDAAWFAPAADALARGDLSRVTLIADGNGAHRWAAPAPAWGARLRARLRTPAFGVTP